jgi:hypothetical protein
MTSHAEKPRGAASSSHQSTDNRRQLVNLAEILMGVGFIGIGLMGQAMARNLLKLAFALSAAEAENVPMPVASLVRDHFISGIARGKADLDWSAPARVAAENAGL